MLALLSVDQICRGLIQKLVMNHISKRLKLNNIFHTRTQRTQRFQK
jgi:hypothetical protein